MLNWIFGLKKPPSKPERGVFIFNDNTNNVNTTVLFIYKKQTKDQLQKALPYSYSAQFGEYLVGYLKNKKDFVGQSDIKNIMDAIQEKNMTNVFEMDYDSAKKQLPDLTWTEEEFNEMIQYIVKYFKSPTIEK